MTKLIGHSIKADIQGYLRDQKSDHVVVNYRNHHTLVKFQKWGVLIVKIITKHFGNNLADKKSRFIPKEKLHEMKLTRQKHVNSFVVNGHPAVTWKTFSPKSNAYQKLNQLVKKFNHSGSGKH